MTLASMTGFATARAELGDARWTWEIKSVNSRGLDVRLRYPSGMDAVEAPAKLAITKALTRGNVTANLTLERAQAASPLRLDKAALEAAIKIAGEIQDASGGEPASTDALMGMRGVIVADDAGDDVEETGERNTAILATLDDAISGLQASRAGEGAELASVLKALLDEIERLKTQIEKHPARSAEAIAARLKQQVSRLLEAGGADAFDEARLYQEAALLATRADIEEELRRIDAHLVAATGLLAGDGAVGRKLDFLAQEFNREANTICSKSNDAEVSGLGLDLKSTIDRLREQVQNVE